MSTGHLCGPSHSCHQTEAPDHPGPQLQGARPADHRGRTLGGVWKQVSGLHSTLPPSYKPHPWDKEYIVAFLATINLHQIRSPLPGH